MASVNSGLCHASHYPDGAAKASMPHLGHEGDRVHRFPTRLDTALMTTDGKGEHTDVRRDI